MSNLPGREEPIAHEGGSREIGTTLPSTTRVFLGIHTYYYMDVTPVTGKTMLFVKNSAIHWT